MGYDGKYVSIAVQLANNNIKFAMKLGESNELYVYFIDVVILNAL